jgi:flotillin
MEIPCCLGILDIHSFFPRPAKITKNEPSTYPGIKKQTTMPTQAETLQKALEVGIPLVAAAGFLAFAASRYKTSRSNQWLVRTGLGVGDMEIKKKFVHWPFQNIQTIDMTPASFKFSVNAMSKEKMEFTFPAVFTIGPKNDLESLQKYARFLLVQDNQQTRDLICGIIEGETRTLSANLSIEDMFSGRSAFKQDIVGHVKAQLDQYGLEIYNANIEELKDSDSSNYFRSLAQKIKAEAENKAKVEVAEQNKKGDIGAKERESETRQRVAIVEAEATLVENTRKQEILKSQADLEKTKAEQDNIIQQANIRAKQEAEALQMSLQREVELRRSEMELEKQRAKELTKATVAAETAQKEAEGHARSQRILAEAALYQKQKEAEGLTAMYEAQATGLQRLVGSFGGDARALLSYTMLEKGVYEKLAEANAKAIKDLNPKITVWTHDPNTSMSAIQNLGKALIPMLDTMEDQTGYKMPSWVLEKKELQ